MPQAAATLLWLVAPPRLITAALTARACMSSTPRAASTSPQAWIRTDFPRRRHTCRLPSARRHSTTTSPSRRSAWRLPRTRLFHQFSTACRWTHPRHLDRRHARTPAPPMLATSWPANTANSRRCARSSRPRRQAAGERAPTSTRNTASRRCRCTRRSRLSRRHTRLLIRRRGTRPRSRFRGSPPRPCRRRASQGQATPRPTARGRRSLNSLRSRSCRSSRRRTSLLFLSRPSRPRRRGLVVHARVIDRLRLRHPQLQGAER